MIKTKRKILKKDESEISGDLTKTMLLIDTYKVNNPINAKFLCYIPYNMNQNISSIKLYILMSFLNEKFGSLTGVSHTENKYFFRILVWLYELGENTEGRGWERGEGD